MTDGGLREEDGSRSNKFLRWRFQLELGVDDSAVDVVDVPFALSLSSRTKNVLFDRIYAKHSFGMQL
jgi:hypothetical protein